MRRIYLAGGGCALWAALLTQLPTPARLWAALAGNTADHPADQLWANVDQGVGLAVGAIVWTLTCWASVILVLGALSLLAGVDARADRRGRAAAALGRAAGSVLPKVAPATARRIVFAVIGMGTLAGVTACSTPGTEGPAAAPGGAPAAASVDARPAAAAPDQAGRIWDLDWPASPVPAPTADTGQDGTHSPAGSTHRIGQISLDWPTTGATGRHRDTSGDVDTPAVSRPASPTGHPADTARRPSADATVTVEPGDSLWSIAAAHLPAGADDSRIDATWRQWYQVNKDRIGADPDLIRSGMQLVVPPSTDQASSPRSGA